MELCYFYRENKSIIIIVEYGNEIRYEICLPNLRRHFLWNYSKYIFIFIIISVYNKTVIDNTGKELKKAIVDRIALIYSTLRQSHSSSKAAIIFS